MIMRRHLVVLASALTALLAAAAPAGAQAISGSGSTLAHPILSQWSKAYQGAQADAEFQPIGTGLDYEPVGSEAGIQRLRAGEVDFAATDRPLAAEELKTYGFSQFPIVIAGVAIATQLDGVTSGRLKLTGPLLADIYLGRITRWSDPRLRELNAGLTLPDAPIVVIRRQDGSGTTFTVTNYLSRVSPDWKRDIGEGLTVAWRVGEGAKGNGGMAEKIRATPGAIGYVDYAQALRAKLAVATLRNGAGGFVGPELVAVQAAATGADWGGARDFGLVLNDGAGPATYPIVATTFAVLRRDGASSKRTQKVLAFMGWSLDQGAATAASLGFVALPPELVARVKRSWLSDFGVWSQ